MAFPGRGPQETRHAAPQPRSLQGRAVTGQYVFGFGSLAGETSDSDKVALDPRAAVLAQLPGFRRIWGVAMDNTVDIPGYKSYRDVNGERPAVMVAFLDITPDVGTTVEGVCQPVTAQQLAALDARERNYVRIDVTAALVGQPAGRHWLYLGSQHGRERARLGRMQGRLAVAQEYYRQVRQAFERLGRLPAFLNSTDHPGPILRELTRVDVTDEG